MDTCQFLAPSITEASFVRLCKTALRLCGVSSSLKGVKLIMGVGDRSEVDTGVTGGVKLA